MTRQTGIKQPRYGLSDTEKFGFGRRKGGEIGEKDVVSREREKKQKERDFVSRESEYACCLNSVGPCSFV